MNGSLAMDAKVELCSFTRSYVKTFWLSTAKCNLRLLTKTNVRGKSEFGVSFLFLSDAQRAASRRKQRARNIFTYTVVRYN